VVHGSHPCAAVEKALSLKGLSYGKIEWPPPLHAAMQRLLFGVRTVPALRIDAEKISGSRAIMQRLDALVPEPVLYPAGGAERARVEEADRWGDEVFQSVARELLWVGFSHNPSAMVSYTEHSKLPLPKPVVRASAPLIAAAQRRLNRTDDAIATAAIRTLPSQLDQIDAWIADGRIGDAGRPNAADLQLLSTTRLLLTIADVAPLIDARPAGKAARRLFGSYDGLLPVGALPAA
jgi:glutathione S-transferase